MKEIDTLDNEYDFTEAFVENDLETIQHSVDRTGGLKFRLNIFNELFGGLIKGDFGILGAYAEVGKTGFLISEATYMAQQMTTGCVLWLNNEEPETRIYKKIWEATLETNWPTIIKHKEKAAIAFKKRMNGDMNRIRIYDVRSMAVHHIRKLVEKLQPKIVIIDLADNLSYRGEIGQADHLRLSRLYKELRVMSKEFCPVLVASHTDASVRWHDKSANTIKSIRYIDHTKLAGSKIGKAGEADFVIMMSKDDNDECPYIRYINVSKNKLSGETNKSVHLCAEIYYDPDKHHYINPEEVK